jgi:DNA-binding NarL/FixJ family response regulator
VPAPIRILVADDHPVVRDGLAAMLGTQGDFEIVGAAASGVEAVERAAALKPDIVLMDLEMAGRDDGVAAIGRLAEETPESRVLVFTAFDRDEQIVGAIKAGARGYLLKGAPRDEVFRAIRAVHAGGSLVEPVVASKLLRRVRENGDAATPREVEVLRLVARGLPNKAIARELGVTERTVKFHVGSLLGKLDASNRTQAVARARARGLL